MASEDVEADHQPVIAYWRCE